jgi:hypothetical protein
MRQFLILCILALQKGAANQGKPFLYVGKG